MKDVLVKIASRDRHFRRELIRKLAIEFSTQDAFDKYMEEHENADPKNHSVSKSKGVSKGIKKVKDIFGKLFPGSSWKKMSEATDALNEDLSDLRGDSKVKEEVFKVLEDSDDFSDLLEPEELVQKFKPFSGGGGGSSGGKGVDRDKVFKTVMGTSMLGGAALGAKVGAAILTHGGPLAKAIIGAAEVKEFLRKKDLLEYVSGTDIFQITGMKLALTYGAIAGAIAVPVAALLLLGGVAKIQDSLRGKFASKTPTKEEVFEILTTVTPFDLQVLAESAGKGGLDTKKAQAAYLKILKEAEKE